MFAHLANVSFVTHCKEVFHCLSVNADSLFEQVIRLQDLNCHWLFVCGTEVFISDVAR